MKRSEMIKIIRNYIRLNYSFPAEDDIVEGIKVLGEMLKARI